MAPEGGGRQRQDSRTRESRLSFCVIRVRHHVASLRRFLSRLVLASTSTFPLLFHWTGTMYSFAGEYGVLAYTKRNSLVKFYLVPIDTFAK